MYLTSGFTKKLRKELVGYAEIIRYADDFVILVQNKEDAEKILKSLRHRLEKFGLELSESKTKVVRFGRTANKNVEGNKPGTFDFLGFTHYCDKSRKGYFKVGRKTSAKRYSQKIREMKQFLKRIRNKCKLNEIWHLLKLKLIGHYRYYGVSENSRSISNYYFKVENLIFKWLNRRSQRKVLTGIISLSILESIHCRNPKSTSVSTIDTKWNINEEPCEGNPHARSVRGSSYMSMKYA